MDLKFGNAYPVLKSNVCGRLVKASVTSKYFDYFALLRQTTLNPPIITGLDVTNCIIMIQNVCVNNDVSYFPIKISRK